MKEKHKELIKICDEYIKSYTERLNHLRGRITFIEKNNRFLTMPENSSLEYRDDYIKSYEEMKLYIDFNGYLVISLLDICVNLKNIVASKTRWEDSFFIKNSYLVIHETTNKISKSDSRTFLEKSIREELPSLEEELNKVTTQLDNFKNTEGYKETILKTRHNIAGHIIKDFKKHYDRTFNLDKEKAIKYIFIFVGILSDSIGLINDYLEFKEGKE